MKPNEIVELIKSEQPRLLTKITDQRAALIIRGALSQIAKQVAALDQGVIKVAGLGHFVVRQVERGAEPEGKVKRVFFKGTAKAGAERAPKEGPAASTPPRKPQTANAGKKNPARKKPPRPDQDLF